MSWELYWGEKIIHYYMLESGILWNYSQKHLGVLRGDFWRFGCPNDPHTQLTNTMASPVRTALYLALMACCPPYLPRLSQQRGVLPYAFPLEYSPDSTCQWPGHRGSLVTPPASGKIDSEYTGRSGKNTKVLLANIAITTYLHCPHSIQTCLLNTRSAFSPF